MEIKIIKELNNNKFPKIVLHANKYYIFGILSKTMANNNGNNNNINLNKFVIFYETYDLDFNFILKKEITHSFEKSTLIWDIIENDNYYIFLIEQKSIHLTKHECTFYKYYIIKKELEMFQIAKIETINIENCLVSKMYQNYILSSKIEIDEERPNYYWGKYLFYFIDKTGHEYRPNFDTILNYTKDKGHIIHFIEKDKKTNIHTIIFSIRHKSELIPDTYYYNIYCAQSEDLINFYNTQQIKINNSLSNSKWYCYPVIFKQNNTYYVILNQDDFGKGKSNLLGILTF